MLQRTVGWWLAGCVCVPAWSRAQEVAPHDVPLHDAGLAAVVAPVQSLTFYFDNDGTFVRPNDNTDRHYTSGQGFSLAWRGAGTGFEDALGLAPAKTAAGLVVAQQIFTPDNIDQPPEPGDRPYAGFLFVGGFWQREKSDVLDHVQLDVGVVGPSSQAEFVQESIHDLFDAPDPDYDDQLEDELQVNLILRRKWRVGLGETVLAGQPIGWQLIPRVDLELGTTFRRASAGGLLRVGYQLPDDFGPGRLTDVASETTLTFEGRDTGLSVYLFGGAVARYVEFNTLLDGSFSRDPSLSVERIPLVGEFSGGFGLEWKRHGLQVRLAYQQTYFTREFETQDGENTVGSIALRLIYGF